MGVCVVLFGMMFQVIGMALNIIGVATSNWLYWTQPMNETVTNSDDNEIMYRIGLFRLCTDQSESCTDIPHGQGVSNDNDDFEIAQATILAGMLLGIMSIFFSIAYWGMALLGKARGRKAILVFVVITFILAPLFTAAGATVYFLKMESKFDHWEISDIGFSAYTCVIGMVMIPLFGSLSACGADTIPPPIPSNGPPSSAPNDDPANGKVPGDSANAPASDPNQPRPIDSSASPDVRPNNGPTSEVNDSRPTFDTRPVSTTNQPISEPRPTNRSQSFYEGAPNQFANETRPIARTQSINTHPAYPNTMPTHYGATPSNGYFEQ